MRSVSTWHGRQVRQAVADVVRHRSRFGDLLEVADLAIALDTVGAGAAARHFRRIAAALRDEHGPAPAGQVAHSRRLGDPYCVFDAVRTDRSWTVPRWVVDGGQVLLLAEDVVAVALALGRLRGTRDRRREARSAARFARELTRGEGLVVDLHSLPANQRLG
jgi:hypothetical protein